MDFLREIDSKDFVKLMSYYKCAMMEIETKFNVLNEELSLQYDRNPIESIKSRLKSPDSIIKKLNRKELPFSLESIEENINDVAGRIMDKIDDEQNMHAFLLEEQSGLSSEELNFCYLKFENLSLLYPTPIYEYPHSVVDSLSCIMIYKKQKNKLFK